MLDMQDILRISVFNTVVFKAYKMAHAISKYIYKHIFSLTSLSPSLSLLFYFLVSFSRFSAAGAAVAAFAVHILLQFSTHGEHMCVWASPAVHLCVCMYKFFLL